MGLTPEGRIDMIEIRSPSQTVQSLYRKLEEAMGRLPEHMRGEFDVIDPQDAFR
jgi:hypothetical protein